MLTAPFYVLRNVSSLLFGYKPTYCHNSSFMPMDYYVYFVLNSRSFSMIAKVFLLNLHFLKFWWGVSSVETLLLKSSIRKKPGIPRKDYKGVFVMLWQNTKITYFLRGWVSLCVEVMIFPEVFKSFSRELGHCSC